MRKLQHKLWCYFTILSVIPVIIIGFLSYNVFVKSLKQKILENSLTSVSQITKNIDTRFLTIEAYIDLLSQNPRIQEILKNVDFENYNVELFLASRDLIKIFKGVIIDSLENVILISNNKKTYVHGPYIKNIESYYDSDWYKKVIDGKGKIIWSSTKQVVTDEDESFNNLLAGKVIRNTSFNMKPLGIIAFNINKNFITENMSDGSNGEYINNIILNRYNEIIYNNNSESIEDIKELAKKITYKNSGYFDWTINNQPIIVLYDTSKITGWKVIRFVSKDYYNEEIYSISRVTIIVVILTALLVWFASYVISIKISKPIKELQIAMDSVGRKNFNVSVPIYSNDEISDISRGFNIMVKQLKRLFSQAVLKEREIRNAEYKALQYQINSHFLYNTLTTIRLTALKSNDKNVSNMLLVLSRLLKNSISKSSKWITIQEEMINLKDYLAIYNVRYNGSIKSQFEIQQSILNVKVPGMLFQPIVENAIIHGLSDKINDQKPAIVKISGISNISSIIISITDYGIGISKEKIDKILNSETKSIKSNSHIGLKNINDRLTYQFGENYGVNIESQEGKYTTVSVRLPYKNEK